MTHESHTELPMDDAQLVYVRPISAEEIGAILPANALEELGTTEDLFAVHNSAGERLAIVEGRDAAFAAARAHKLTPTSLH
ncbi:MAG: DUF1150 family protein [Pseudomonadota bacterium]